MFLDMTERVNVDVEEQRRKGGREEEDEEKWEESDSDSDRERRRRRRKKKTYKRAGEAAPESDEWRPFTSNGRESTKADGCLESSGLGRKKKEVVSTREI